MYLNDWGSITIISKFSHLINFLYQLLINIDLAIRIFISDSEEIMLTYMK